MDRCKHTVHIVRSKISMNPGAFLTFCKNTSNEVVAQPFQLIFLLTEKLHWHDPLVFLARVVTTPMLFQNGDGYYYRAMKNLTQSTHAKFVTTCCQIGTNTTFHL